MGVETPWEDKVRWEEGTKEELADKLHPVACIWETRTQEVTKAGSLQNQACHESTGRLVKPSHGRYWER